jgi:Fur family ferric uptake transcriptional regulator
MKILADCGLAREIDLADGITRYEHLYNHQHHDHMICMQCGISIEFYNADIEALQDEASEQLGFKVLDHKLQIYGLCRDCGQGSGVRDQGSGVRDQVRDQGSGVRD